MDSFRNYLAGCALPPMENAKNAPLLPPGGHKSHLNHLQVRPETWRRLERMHSLEGGIDSVIVNWMNDNVPEDPLDLCEIDSDERLTIPCPSIVDAFPNVMKKPDNVSRMVPWLELLPLQTVETTLHLLYPHIQDWGFVLIDDPDNWDKDIFQYFSLSAKGSQISRSSLTLAFQPPWILSDQDIKEFAECRTFPPFRRSGNAYPIKLESYHRLWAKMWDVCVRRRTHWFVLTSYNTWVFGAFSEGWSSAFVTGVYTHDSCNPSIAECLAFWAISALRIAGSASVPKVGDGTEYALFETPCVIYDVMGQNMEEVPETLGHILLPVSIPLPRPAIRLEAPTNSVSNWAGKNDDVTSSAGVYSNLSETCSYDSGISGTVAPMNRPEGRSSLRNPMLTKWLATASSDAVLNAQVDIPPIARQLAPMTASAMGDWLV